MAGYPLNDWGDLDAGGWYELHSDDDETVNVARFTGTHGTRNESAWFEVDGQKPSREFWQKYWVATRTQNPYG